MGTCSEDSACFWVGPQSSGICKPVCSYLGPEDCNSQDHCKQNGPSSCTNK